MAAATTISRNDYGGDRVIINDTDHAQYRLNKIFEENWTAVSIPRPEGDAK
jgi:hypothetical protein